MDALFLSTSRLSRRAAADAVVAACDRDLPRFEEALSRLERAPESARRTLFDLFNPCHAAAAAEAPEIVETLFARGYPVDAFGGGVCTDRTPLSIAAERGALSVVSLLLSLGADPTLGAPGKSALDRARGDARALIERSLLAPSCESGGARRRARI